MRWKQIQKTHFGFLIENVEPRWSIGIANSQSFVLSGMAKVGQSVLKCNLEYREGAKNK